MGIKGLTDRGLAFPAIGSIRKGAKKTEANKPGGDLKYFRVEFDERETESAEIFRKIYGNQPTEINILLPFNEIDKVWDAWHEAYTAGRMVARSDGEFLTYLLDVETGEVRVLGGHPKTPHPADGIVGYYKDSKGSRQPIKLKPVGRMKVVIPELKRLAYLTLHTTSIHDIMNLSSQLEAIRVMNSGRIAGVPLILRRRPKMISTPAPDGQRVRREKWLLSIEADPQWVKAKLLEIKHLSLPGNGLNLLPEKVEDFPVEVEADDDDDEYEDGETYIVDEPPEEYAPANQNTKMERPLTPDALKEALYKSASKGSAGFDEKKRQEVAATLEYIFMSKDKRHDFIRWLTDGKTESIKEVDDSLVMAMMRWLRPVYSPEKAAFIPTDPHAAQEASAAWGNFMRESGQLEMQF
jgi:hypothetical protein